MGFFGQVGLLLWKNWLLQKRKICVSIFEVLLPVAFAILVLLIRLAVKAKDYPNPTYYPAQPLLTNTLNLSRNSQIGFTPNTLDTNKVMDKVINRLNSLSNNITCKCYTFLHFVTKNVFYMPWSCHKIIYLVACWKDYICFSTTMHYKNTIFKWALCKQNRIETFIRIIRVEKSYVINKDLILKS